MTSYAFFAQTCSLGVVAALGLGALSCERLEPERGDEPQRAPDLSIVTPPRDAPEPHPSETAAQSSITTLERVEFDAHLLSDEALTALFKDPVVKSVTWRDRHGDHVFALTVALTSQGGGTIRALHFARQDDVAPWSSVRRYAEALPSCEHQRVMTPLLDPSWSLTDLDADGQAEVTFAWQVGCALGPEPVEHKVLIEEQGSKHILRGTTLARLSPYEQYGGEFDVDASFDQAPKEFLAHAERVWAKTRLLDYDSELSR